MRRAEKLTKLYGLLSEKITIKLQYDWYKFNVRVETFSWKCGILSYSQSIQILVSLVPSLHLSEAGTEGWKRWKSSQQALPFRVTRENNAAAVHYWMLRPYNSMELGSWNENFSSLRCYLAKGIYFCDQFVSYLLIYTVGTFYW